MSVVQGGGAVAAELAEALGLPKDRTVSLRLTLDVKDIARVEAVVYPTSEQLHEMARIAREVRERGDWFETGVDRESKALAIVRDVLGE